MSASRAAADYFSDRAGSYDGAYDRRTADGYALRSRMVAVVDLVGNGPGELLDAGMGPGRLCAELAGHGWTVSGVDAASDMVELARARLPEAHDRLRCATIESLPFPDASFDVVTATGVLEYSDVRRALQEFARVLRPGGRVVVSYPNPRALYGIWKTRLWYPLVRTTKRLLRRPNAQMPHGAGELPATRFVAALAAAGLETTGLVHTSYLSVPAPLDRLFPRVTIGIGRRLERGGSRTAALFATQIVYDARLGEETL
jgi:SAM-dependent methyltransferase